MRAGVLSGHFSARKKAIFNAGSDQVDAAMHVACQAAQYLYMQQPVQMV